MRWLVLGMFFPAIFCLAAQPPAPAVRDSLAEYMMLSRTYGGYKKDSSLIFARLAVRYLQRKPGTDLRIQADVYRNLGVSFYEAGNIPEAMAAYEKGLVFARKAGDKLGEAKCLFNMGNGLSHLGMYPGALEHYLKALSLAESLRNLSLKSNILNSLGAFYYETGSYTKARTHYETALRLRKQIGEYAEASFTLNNLANLSSAEGQIAPAIAFYNQSIELSKKHHLLSHEATTRSNLGEMFRKIGQYDSARIHCRQALSILADLDEKSVMAHVLATLGMIELESFQFDSSRAHLNRSLAICLEIKERNMAMRVYNMLSSLEELDGRFAEALFFHKAYALLQDSLLTEAKANDLGKLEGKFELERQLAEEKRARQREEDRRQKEERRIQNMQYLGMVAGVVLGFMLVFLAGRFHMSIRAIEISAFFATLIFFELLLVITDPYLEILASSRPLYKWVLNTLMALCIFPLHSFLEESLKRRMAGLKAA